MLQRILGQDQGSSRFWSSSDGPICWKLGIGWSASTGHQAERWPALVMVYPCIFSFLFLAGRHRALESDRWGIWNLRCRYSRKWVLLCIESPQCWVRTSEPTNLLSSPLKLDGKMQMTINRLLGTGCPYALSIQQTLSADPSWRSDWSCFLFQDQIWVGCQSQSVISPSGSWSADHTNIGILQTWPPP